MATWGLSLVVKATLVLSLTLLAVHLARHSRAAVRHLWLTAGFLVLLVLPLAAALVPEVHVEVLPAPSVPAEYMAEPVPIAALPAVSVPPSQNAGMPAAPRWTPTLGEMLTAMWLAGVLLCALPVAVGVAQVRRFRRKALPWLDGQSMVSTLANDAGLRRPVEVALHESIDAPATCGIRRPLILFPVDARTWPDEDIMRAAVHELEHVRRADCLVNAFARVMCAAYWFHPLAWVAWRRLSLEAERACDDAVVRRADATTYADQLVALAGRLPANTRYPLLAMANRNDLVQRVAAVLDQRQARGRVDFRLGAVIMAAALTAAIAISPLQAVTRQAGATAGTNPGAQPPASPSSVASEITRARADIPAWEAVSVRPCAPGTAGGRGAGGPRGANLPSLSPGSMILRCQTVASLAASAYVLHANGQRQPMWAAGESGIALEGGPDWARSEAYTITAKADGTPSVAMMQGPMLQAILEDRFRLKVRREARDVPVYELIAASGGAKLRPFMEGTCVPIDPAIEEVPPPRLPSGQRYCGRFGSPKPPNFEFDAEGTTVEEFTKMFLSGSPFVGRRVIDRTGIAGRFDFLLEFSPTRGAGDPAALSDSAGPSIFTALQEQLGLRLRAARAPGEFLVIESAERPTETDRALENVDIRQERSVMGSMTIPARSIAALMIGVASVSAGHAQSVDAFRIGSADRPANRPSNLAPPAQPGAERQLEEAFLSARTWTDLSLSAAVAFRQLNRAEYAVPVSVRIAPAFELTVGRGERSRLDFIAAVTDGFGITIANMRDAAELTLDAASIAALATTPIVYETSFVLLPGNYMLKVLARDQTTGRIGSTSVTFTIPNLNRTQPRP